MFSILRMMIDRFKVLFVTHAVFELEADLIALRSERSAELLRRAGDYEAKGLPCVAQELRRQAVSLVPDPPPGSVLAAVAHLQVEPPEPAQPIDVAAPALPNASSTDPEITPPAPSKKKVR